MMFILFWLLFIVNCQCKSVTLYYHQWCKKCKTSVQIFDKLEQLFNQNLTISKVKIVGQNYQVSQQSYSEQQILTFSQHLQFIHAYPTIVFDGCTNSQEHTKIFTYQNDLSLIQLSYWIQVSCFQHIPVCTKKIQSNSPNYQIPSSLQNNLKAQVINWIQQNPAIRICSNSTLNENFNSTVIAQMLRDIQSLPLFFDKFSHNIRNYLIKTQKTAIVSIVQQQNSQNAKNFQQYYKRVTNFRNKSLTNTGFSLQQSDLQKLVFIQVSLYNNKGKQNKIAFKLVEYLEQANSIGSLFNNDITCAIRFKDGQLLKNIYDSMQQRVVKGNKFSYWIHQMKQLGQKQHISNPVKRQIVCLRNYIVFRYSIYDLSAIMQVVKIERVIKQSGTNFQMTRMHKKWWSQTQGEGLTFCKEGKKPLRNISFQNTIQLLNQQRSQQNKKSQQISQEL